MKLGVHGWVRDTQSIYVIMAAQIYYYKMQVYIVNSLHTIIHVLPPCFAIYITMLSENFVSGQNFSTCIFLNIFYFTNMKK